MAAQAARARARPGPPARSSRRPAAARTGSPCRSSRPPTARTDATRQDERRCATTLARQERRRATTVLDRMNAAVPRSRSVATAPIARMIAANAPNWARFFQSWSTASAAVGVGIGIAGELVAAGRLDDLGQELREQRRAQADEQEQAGDDRQAIRPPRLEQLLAQRGSDSRAHAAAPSRRARRGAGRRPRATAGPARRRPAGRPAATTSGSSPADGGRLVA